METTLTSASDSDISGGLEAALPRLRQWLGVYVPAASYLTACAFIAGYDAANGDPDLVGFSKWMRERGKSRPELHWPWLVLCELYPKDDLRDPRHLTEVQDAEALVVLFDLLTEHFAVRRESSTGA
ncbi:MAG: hypothetical protein ACT4QF_23915 [Sporichthyaceae bacterium]